MSKKFLSQIQSTVATGTAPLIVASTTAVTNLNADLLDGQHGAYFAPIASPTLTGTPLSTTAAVDTNTTQIATTAFVLAQAASASPASLGSVAVGTSTRYARADHVHPTTGLGLTSGNLSQFASTTSLQLLGIISDETGSGSLVFATSPTLSQPIIDNLRLGYSTIVTAAGTTTLTATSSMQQFFTGTTTQTVVLPVTSTLALGQAYIIHNNSTGIVTVQSSGFNNIYAIPAGVTVQFTCILITGTTAASWDFDISGSTSISGTGSNAFTISPTFTGTPLAPTAAVSTNTTQIATTQYVNAEIANDAIGKSGLQVITQAAGSTINTAGQVNTLQILQSTAGSDAFMTFHISGDYAAHFGIDGTTNDLSYGGWSAGAAKYRVWHAGNQTTLFTSPTLTGTPTAPTATAGTNTTQIATTAFVTTAVAGSGAASAGFDAFFLPL